MPFLGVEPTPGVARCERVPLGRLADGSPVSLPVIALGGSSPGPTAYLQAGVHGDELTAIEVCRQVVASLDPSELRGNVVAVPIANIPAYLNRSRSFLFEERGPNDINRLFPGKADGLLTERVAAAISEQFVPHIDYAIDFHSGLAGCVIAPCVYVGGAPEEPVREPQERVADAFALDYICLQEGTTKFGHTDLARSFCSYAQSQGVAAVMAEMGESGRISWDRVERGVRGARRALAAMGNLAPDADGEPQAPARRFRNLRFVHSDTGGLVRQVRALGEEVVAGDVVALITDPITSEVTEVETPIAGVVFRQLTLGACHVGAEVVWIAHGFVDGGR
jgi:predicted deacylase